MISAPSYFLQYTNFTFIKPIVLYSKNILNDSMMFQELKAKQVCAVQ